MNDDSFFSAQLERDPLGCSRAGLHDHARHYRFFEDLGAEVSRILAADGFAGTEDVALPRSFGDRRMSFQREGRSAILGWNSEGWLLTFESYEGPRTGTRVGLRRELSVPPGAPEVTYRLARAQLLAAVNLVGHAPTAEPTRARFRVEQVFTITNRGTVLGGKVVEGSLYPGCIAEIPGSGPVPIAAVDFGHTGKETWVGLVIGAGPPVDELRDRLRRGRELAVHCSGRVPESAA